MKRKKLDVKKLKLDKRSIVNLDKAKRIEGGDTLGGSCYSCACTKATGHWDCTGQWQCMLTGTDQK